MFLMRGLVADGRVLGGFFKSRQWQRVGLPSVVALVAGWCVLFGISGNLAILLLLAGLAGLVCSAWFYVRYVVETQGLLAVLPSFVRESLLNRSLVEVVRSPPGGRQRRGSRGVAQRARPSVGASVGMAAAQVGGVVALSAFLGAVDDQNFSQFLGELPRSVRRLVTRRGALLDILPPGIRDLMLPRAAGPDPPAPRSHQGGKGGGKSASGWAEPAQLEAPMDAKAAGAILADAPALDESIEALEANENKEQRAGPAPVDAKARPGARSRPRRRQTTQLPLSRQSISTTVRAFRGLATRFAMSYYRPAAQQIQRTVNTATRGVLTSALRPFEAISSGSLACAAGASTGAFVLQLVLMRRARLRTVRLIEALLYALTILAMGGVSVVASLRYLARRLRARRGRPAGIRQASDGVAVSWLGSGATWVSENRLPIGVAAGSVLMVLWRLRWLRRRLRM